MQTGTAFEWENKIKWTNERYILSLLKWLLKRKYLNILKQIFAFLSCVSEMTGNNIWNKYCFSRLKYQPLEVSVFLNIRKALIFENKYLPSNIGPRSSNIILVSWRESVSKINNTHHTNHPRSRNNNKKWIMQSIIVLPIDVNTSGAANNNHYISPLGRADFFWLPLTSTVSDSPHNNFFVERDSIPPSRSRYCVTPKNAAIYKEMKSTINSNSKTTRHLLPLIIYKISQKLKKDEKTKRSYDTLHASYVWDDSNRSDGGNEKRIMTWIVDKER